jgi:tetratricopeptide (TPR) repeat protein
MSDNHKKYPIIAKTNPHLFEFAKNKKNAKKYPKLLDILEQLFEYEPYMKKIFRGIEDKNYDKALRSCRAFRKAYPKSNVPYNCFGIIYFKKGNERKAAYYLNEEVKISPTADTCFMLGILLLRQGKYEQSKLRLEMAKELNIITKSEQIEKEVEQILHYVSGMIEWQKDNLEDAKKEFLVSSRLAIKKSKNKDRYYTIKLLYYMISVDNKIKKLYLSNSFEEFELKINHIFDYMENMLPKFRMINYYINYSDLSPVAKIIILKKTILKLLLNITKSSKNPKDLLDSIKNELTRYGFENIEKVTESIKIFYKALNEHDGINNAKKLPKIEQQKIISLLRPVSISIDGELSIRHVEKELKYLSNVIENVKDNMKRKEFINVTKEGAKTIKKVAINPIKMLMEKFKFTRMEINVIREICKMKDDEQIMDYFTMELNTLNTHKKKIYKRVMIDGKLPGKKQLLIEKILNALGEHLYILFTKQEGVSIRKDFKSKFRQP